jgi:hypothetical protein
MIRDTQTSVQKKRNKMIIIFNRKFEYPMGTCGSIPRGKAAGA